jgi:Domain of unknown function (DUF4375)
MPSESDPIARKLNELVSSEALYMGLLFFEELNLAEQAPIGSWELVNEVCNGGFVQYFLNSSREHANPMVGVLRAIEAPRVVAILESAIALAGPGTPWGDEPSCFAAINYMPEEVKRRVHELEDQLYDELDDLHLKVFRFLSKHRDQIDAPADFWTGTAIQ